MSAYAPYLPALFTASAFDTAVEEPRADAATQAESRAVTSFGDTPVIVLSVTRNCLSPQSATIVHADHVRYAAQSSHGALVLADTGH